MATLVPHIKYVWNRYGQATQRNGKDAVVELRITHNKRVKYISTGVRLRYSQWRDGMVINHQDCVELNRLFDGYKKKVYDIITDMQQEGKIDIFAIPMRLNKKEQRQNLSEFIRNRMEVRAYGKVPPLQYRYRYFVDFFFSWGKIKTFDDITDENVVAFDRYLEKRGLKASSKWNNYHRFLNSFICDAISAGIITHNPYKYIKIDQGNKSDGLKKCLTPEEFSRLRNAELPSEKLREQRDVFVVQTLLGMSYQDLADISRKNVQEVDGKPVLTGERHKSGVEYVKPILPEVQEILVRYNYKLPILKRGLYNSRLRDIAAAAGIDKPISSHWARHTGATLLLNSGAGLPIVAKVLGHSSTHITEKVYAKLLDGTVVNEVFKTNIGNLNN